MRKFFVFLPLLMFVLGSCAAPAGAAVRNTVVSSPNASLATPAVGAVTVRNLQGMEALLLRNQPGPESPQAGRVAPGQNGKLLGFNEAQTWALVQFSDQSGWAPVEVLDLTIAQ